MVGTRYVARTWRGVSTTYLPEGEGLGGSLPDSSMVGRIGPIPSRGVPRCFVERDELSCATGVCRFTGLGVSATIGFRARALSTSASRVFVGSEADRSFGPSAARAPAARIFSSVSVLEVDFFSRGLDFRGGAGVSGGNSSEGWTVCFGGSGGCVAGCGFFSRATITSCACMFPIIITLQSNARNNRLSMMPRDERMDPLTSPRSSPRRIQPAGRCT
jgi:hypothetical protein